jgi:hypothetical protein
MESRVEIAIFIRHRREELCKPRQQVEDAKQTEGNHTQPMPEKSPPDQLPLRLEDRVRLVTGPWHLPGLEHFVSRFHVHT